MFSSRVPSELAPNRLSAAVHRLRAGGVPFLDLTESNPTRAGFEYPADLLTGLGSQRGQEYRPAPLGLIEARRIVARELSQSGLDVPAERVVLTASTSEAYSLLFKLLCDPGDIVLTPRPSYPLLEHLTRLDGVESCPYTREYHGRWTVDPGEIAARVSARTKAVVVVNPNNPTGSFVTRDELDAIAEICRTRSLALIGDEVFADYPRSALKPISVLGQRGALTFRLGGLSKSVGLPQVKLGWLAIGGPSAFVQQTLERLEIVCDTYLSVGTPVQLALPDLIERGISVRRQIQARLSANWQSLLDAASRAPSLRVLQSDGGWYAVVQVPSTNSEEAMVVELLERDRVLVHPGYFFDFPSEAHIVVSLLPVPDEFTRAIALLCRRLGTPA